MRRRIVEVLVRRAVAALRKLSKRATTTKVRKSSHEMRSSSPTPMGRSVFATGRSEDCATVPRTPALCYFLDAPISREILRNAHTFGCGLCPRHPADCGTLGGRDLISSRDGAVREQIGRGHV